MTNFFTASSGYIYNTQDKFTEKCVSYGNAYLNWDLILSDGQKISFEFNVLQFASTIGERNLQFC